MNGWSWPFPAVRQVRRCSLPYKHWGQCGHTYWRWNCRHQKVRISSALEKVYSTMLVFNVMQYNNYSSYPPPQATPFSCTYVRYGLETRLYSSPTWSFLWYDKARHKCWYCQKLLPVTPFCFFKFGATVHCCDHTILCLYTHLIPWVLCWSSKSLSGRKG